MGCYVSMGLMHVCAHGGDVNLNVMYTCKARMIM